MSVHENVTDVPENIRFRQMHLNRFREIRSIQHPGHIDNCKMSGKIRMIAMNVKGMNPWNQHRMNLLKEAIHKNDVDVVILNETQLKGTPANEDKFNREMKTLGREMHVIGADTMRWEVTPNQRLPGGVMIALRGRAKSVMEDESVHKGKLGNWIAIKLSDQKKKISILNIYRIPVSTSNGNKFSLTQCNLVEGNAKKPSQHRKEILKET